MSAPDIVRRFEREVGAALQAAQLAGRRLVLAVSGGPDSLAMLYALHRLRDESGPTLHVAHLDHRLRGEDSVADAEFVAQTCSQLSVECTVEAENVPGFQKEYRLSPEEAAREVRYRFLARVAEQVGANTVTLGHTSNDQVETVLMNIVRGSGLRGLRGMTPVSKRNIAGHDTMLFRPLLSLSKQDTIAYCEALDLNPRIDDSNLSTEMTRNRIRLELVPILQELNPAIGDAVLRLSTNADEALTFVDRAVDLAWSEVISIEGSAVRIDRERLRELDSKVRSPLLLRAIANVKGDSRGIERVHVDDATRAILESPGSRLDLPGGILLSVEHGAALLLGEDHAIATTTFEASSLTVPGVTKAGEWRITTERVESSSGNGLRDEDQHSPERFVERFGCAIEVTSLQVRSRLPGDRFQPLGMTGTKKLKDFMIDEKIPTSRRDSVPLIVTSQGIAWVVGYRIAEWAKVHGDAHEFLEIRAERIS